MKKGTIIIVAIAASLIAAGAIAFIVYSEKNQIAEQPSSDAIFIYSQAGCSHCIALDDYMEEKDLDDKIEIERRSIDNSRANVTEMIDRASVCGIKTDTIGTPFMWHKGKCLMGDKDIIEYLRQWEN